MSVTETLAKFISRLKFDDILETTQRKAKQCILDWLGVAIRGSQEKGAVILRETLLANGHEASVLGLAGKHDSALNAAFVNGAASHTLDFDDLHNASIVHIATIVVPPAMAVAEKEHKSGKDFLTAVTAGYEVAARVGEAVIPESYYYWHTTGTVGAIGAGAAAARVLGLNEEQTVHTLGSAGTQAAGLWEFVKEGAMSKPLHSGKACYAGVLSAYLAKAGFTAATDILGGEKGFCRAMIEKPHWEKLTEGLGKDFKVDENSFKPYPCCKHSHAAIYSAIELKKAGRFVADNIEKVDILVNSITDSLINNPAPETVYGGKFSIQYCVACALIDGAVTLAHFTAEYMGKPEVRELMKKINVKQDKDVQAVYDKNPDKLASKVIITLNDGKVVEKLTEYPKGDPQNPMTWQESVDKFTALSEPVLGKEKTAALVEFVDKLEKVEDVAAELSKIL